MYRGHDHSAAIDLPDLLMSPEDVDFCVHEIRGRLRLARSATSSVFDNFHGPIDSNFRTLALS